MLSIGTNMSSSYAKAAVSSAAKGMDVAMERLATGKRINAAKDDAAGVAIASRMASKVHGLSQSIRNSMDAQGLISTAEGGFKETESILQRIRELAVQASNDTNSSADRTNLDAEAQKLIEGIDSIASGTTWAGQNLLDGTFSNKAFLIGAGDTTADMLNVSINSSTTSHLGLGFTPATASISQVGGLPQAVTIADGVETSAVGNIIRTQNENGGSGGFVINGIDAGDSSGYSVSNAGDINGDGLADVIVGAPNADPNGARRAGESYVIFGKTDGTAVQLSNVVAGQGGFAINGIDVFDISGWSVSGAGDVNGDGLDDVILGAPRADPNGKIDAGESYVIFGKIDGTAVELSNITAGLGGIVINGASAGDGSGISPTGGDGSGVSVSAAGDVNGDGLDDVIVGGLGGDPNGVDRAGESYVIFGKTDGSAVELSSIKLGLGGFVINGIDAQDDAGRSVSNAGDVNGDGLDDLIVGASSADPSGRSLAGESYVIFGKADGSAVELSTITSGLGGFAINGVYTFDNSGVSVSAAGDVNGDGLDDVIVGAIAAPNGKGEAGESYIIFGKADGAVVELSAIQAGSGGFVINGNSGGDWSGFSVSSGGDVNGDGLGDVIVGTRYADPNGIDRAGESYVIFGKADGSAVELSSVISGMGGFVINGIDAEDSSGYSVSAAGDVNGDGLDDLIVGAPDADPNGIDRAGESYVIFGKADGTAVELSGVSQNPPALSSNATIIVDGKTIAVDLSSYYNGSTNDYYGAAAAVATAINNDVDLQALGYSAVAATAAQVAARTYLAGDVIVSRANTPIITVASNEVPAVPAISLTSRENAQGALSRIDIALDTVNSQRAYLGSLTNRLEHAISNNTNVVINVQGSMSRIQDADYASEAADLAKWQILESSSTAMLAQANASMFEVLVLIRD